MDSNYPTCKFSFSKLRQPTEQRKSNVRTQQIKSIRPILFLYYEESLVSSNLNSNLLRFHCAHPNVNIVIPFLWVISTVKLHNSNDLKPKIFNPDQVYLRKGWGIRSFIRNAKKCKKGPPCDLLIPSWFKTWKLSISFQNAILALLYLDFQRSSTLLG